MALPSQIAYLSLIIFPAEKVFKVGRVIDILNRLVVLKRLWWGEPDYDAPFCVKTEEALVLRLERPLHCFLDEFDAAESSGAGHTELSRVEALSIARRHLELYISGKKPGNYELTKDSMRRCDAQTELDARHTNLQSIRQNKDVLRSTRWTATCASFGISIA